MFNRKLLKRSLLIIPLLIAGGIVVLRDTASVVLLRKAALVIVSPVMSAAGGGYGDAGEAIAKKDMPEEDLIRARVQVLERENAYLKSAFGLERGGIHLKGVRVFYYRQEQGREFLFIGAGQDQGVGAGTLVVDGRGFLVGVVGEVEQTFARVIIASNPDTVFEVTVPSINTQAFAKGMGARTLRLEFVLQDTPVREGDAVLLRRPGMSVPVMLGQIARVGSSEAGSFKEIYATFSARPESLDYVFLVNETDRTATQK